MTEIDESPQEAENIRNPQEPGESEGMNQAQEISQDAQEPDEPQRAEQGQQVSQNARNMAMLCHLLGFFTSFIVPLVIWILKKDEDTFIDEHGKEALNFQISVAVAMAAAILFSWTCIVAPFVFIIPILDLIFCVIASIKASGGQPYRYPLSIRLVR